MRALSNPIWLYLHYPPLAIRGENKQVSLEHTAAPARDDTSAVRALLLPGTYPVDPGHPVARATAAAPPLDHTEDKVERLLAAGGLQQVAGGGWITTNKIHVSLVTQKKSSYWSS